MPKKILWLAATCLMTFSLVLAACASNTPPSSSAPPSSTPATSPTTTPTSTPPTSVPPTSEPTQATTVPATDTPQYGGTLTIATTANANPNGFWDGSHEKFLLASWIRGPAGDNLYDPNAGPSSFEDISMPGPCESWEYPKPGVWVMNIRQGMHWAKTPFPASAYTNGREITAADFAWSMNWFLGSTKSWIWFSQPGIARASSINQTGPWQVTLTTEPGLIAYVWLIGAGGGYFNVHAPEVETKLNHVEIYQGVGWPFQEDVGEGPYIYTDVVASSSITQTRNPNYWMKDPVGPGKGNQLPYIETIKTLTIPDSSTQQAALRTGKIDYMTGLTRDNWQKEMTQTPRYKYHSYLSNTTGNRVIFMRTDKKDLPFSDIRVRQALMMATDFNSIKNNYYDGAAEIDVWPLNSNFKGSGYIPLDQMSQDVQDLYSYNPDKAKQLLKDAGYPDGFKTSVVVTSVGNDVDDLSIIKDMWAKVGVQLNLDVKDSTTFNTIQGSGNYDQMLYRFNYSNFPQDFYFTSHRGQSSNNLSYVDVDYSDATIEAAFKKVNDAMFTDMGTVYKTMEDLRPYLMLSAAVIPRPTPYLYNIWNPWLKNYYGSLDSRYHWIDQNLKKSMGF